MLTYTRRGIEESTSPLPAGERPHAAASTSRATSRTASWVIEASAVASRVTGDRAGDPGAADERGPLLPAAGRVRTSTSIRSPGSLSGHGGFLRVGRTDKGRLRLSDRFNWYSPGLELNDLGYLRQADVRANRAFVGWSEPSPKGPLRSYSVQLARLGPVGLRRAQDLGLDGAGPVRPAPEQVERQRGAALDRGAGRHARAARRPCSAAGQPSCARASTSRATARAAWAARPRPTPTSTARGPRARPTPPPPHGHAPQRAMRVSANLSYSTNRDDLQYVSTASVSAAPSASCSAASRSARGRSPCARTSRSRRACRSSTTAAPSCRPAATGASSARRPRRRCGYRDRFHAFTGDELAYRADGNAYDVDGGAETRYSFGNPDFSFRQFRSNLVLRWEYRPGSSLYVVWSQGRTDAAPEWESRLGSNWNALWRAPARQRVPGQAQLLVLAVEPIASLPRP